MYEGDEREEDHEMDTHSTPMDDLTGSIGSSIGEFGFPPRKSRGGRESRASTLFVC